MLCLVGEEKIEGEVDRCMRKKNRSCLVHENRVKIMKNSLIV